MANIKTATAITPTTLQGQLPTTEAPFYAAATGKALKVSTCRLTNTSGSSVNVWLSVVHSGGTAGDTNRILQSAAIASGASLDVPIGVLNEGDFISAKASAATSVTMALSGFEFASDAVSAASGIQVVANGTRAAASNVNSIAPTIQIPTDANRYIIVPLYIHNNGDQWAAWSSFTALSVTSDKSGALTRLASANFGLAGQETASVHFFGIANPATGLHTLTTNVTKSSGNKFDQHCKPFCYGGVAGVNGVQSYTSGNVAQTLNLSVTSAALNKALCAVIDGSNTSVLYGLNQNIRDYDATYSFDLLLEADGASTVNFTSVNTRYRCDIGLNLIPA